MKGINGFVTEFLLLFSFFPPLLSPFYFSSCLFFPFLTFPLPLIFFILFRFLIIFVVCYFLSSVLSHVLDTLIISISHADRRTDNYRNTTWNWRQTDVSYGDSLLTATVLSSSLLFISLSTAYVHEVTSLNCQTSKVVSSTNISLMKSSSSRN
jgi:hypothetical protein